MHECKFEIDETVFESEEMIAIGVAEEWLVPEESGDEIESDNFDETYLVSSDQLG